MFLKKFITFFWCLKKCLILAHKPVTPHSTYLPKLWYTTVLRNQNNFGSGFSPKSRSSMIMVLTNASMQKTKISVKKP